NPKAIETARALDAERKAKGPRSPLHGIPVVLKDNYDKFDMATNGGSVLLEGSIPPHDAFVVKKLRDAGGIILAKVNMSEFASAGAYSSLGGQSRNPHDLSRSPAGSSGGTGVAIAAGYAPLGMGTDTGGSIRGPSRPNCRRLPISDMVNRRQGRIIYRDSLSGVHGADRGLSRYDRSGLPEKLRSNDRAYQSLQCHACGWCASKPEPLEFV